MKKHSSHVICGLAFSGFFAIPLILGMAGVFAAGEMDAPPVFHSGPSIYTYMEGALREKTDESDQLPNMPPAKVQNGKERPSSSSAEELLDYFSELEKLPVVVPTPVPEFKEMSTPAPAETAVRIATKYPESKAAVIPANIVTRQSAATVIRPVSQQKADSLPPKKSADSKTVAQSDSAMPKLLPPLNNLPVTKDTKQVDLVSYRGEVYLPPTAGHVGAQAEVEAGQWSSVGPFRVAEGETELKVMARRSKLMRTKSDLVRTAIVDPSVCDIIQFTPREISVIGKTLGATHVTFWFKDSTEPVTFLVRTIPDPALRELWEREYKLMEQNLAKIFPNSKVTLTLIANKLVVRGQAKNVEEAAEIMRILRNDVSSSSMGQHGVSEAAVAANELDLGAEVGNKRILIVNMLRIPGVQQVSLRVKMAELSRSKADGAGVDFQLKFNGDKLMLSSLIGVVTGGGGLIAYDCANVYVGLDYLTKKEVLRSMSEATVVALSGTSATMTAGGEIPTPIAVGNNQTVGTEFRSYGTVISFTPTVLDKDLIRLKVNAEFSSLDGGNGNKQTGVPAMRTKRVDDVVQMREGQTFVIGTTLEDTYQATASSNIPVLTHLLGKKSKSRGESEMLILITPELVAPMEPDEVPPLPGFDVTEPTNAQFLLHGRLEGNPTLENRSTVWPNLRNRYLNGGSAIISGPYGH